MQRDENLCSEHFLGSLQAFLVSWPSESSHMHIWGKIRQGDRGRGEGESGTPLNLVGVCGSVLKYMYFFIYTLFQNKTAQKPYPLALNTASYEATLLPDGLNRQNER